MKGFSKEQIISAVHGAKSEARAHAQKYFYEKLGGIDQYACGFAWVNIYGVRSNSKEGKALIEAGFSKSYSGGLQLWDPSDMPVQNVDTKEAGAQAFADYFKGMFPEVEIYAGSRLD
jgi:hypothetical protein